MILIPLLELLSYIAFSFVAGHLVFRFVRKEEAAIRTPRSDLLAAAASAALVTSGPVINLFSVLGAQNGYGQALEQVLLQSGAGRIWIGIFVLGVCVWLLLFYDKFPVLTFILFLGMVFLYAFGSQAGEAGFVDFISRFIHLGASVFWVGVLIHVCFYTPEHFSWESFLKWFKPFVILLVLTVIISSVTVTLSAMDIQDYGNVLMLTYGQVLLIKYILFIPVLVFTIITFSTKKSRLVPIFRPIDWIRSVTILLGIIFICNAILSSSATPANITEVLRNEGSAPIFGSIFPSVTAGSVATWHVGAIGVFCFFGFCLIMASLIFILKKKAAAGLALAAAFAASGLLYAAIMTSVQF
ncbi:hypothetical protein SFC66_14915 [Terribacillus saccharophilus]|uniref:copper resistance D family protein n=1 Tax=Terribacillus saccharophilus TaxID=361277 RepID=UPI003982622E